MTTPDASPDDLGVDTGEIDLAQVSLATDASLPVAYVRGEIDISNAPSLRARLLDRPDARARGLVLDLTATSYLDSAGVRLLFDLHRTLLESTHGLRVVVPPDAPIRRVLKMTNFEGTTAVYDSPADALRP